MTREELVGRLLQEKKITAEEAVILLIPSASKEYIVVQPFTIPAAAPIAPWIQPPFTITCSANGGTVQN